MYIGLRMITIKHEAIRRSKRASYTWRDMGRNKQRKQTRNGEKLRMFNRSPRDELTIGKRKSREVLPQWLTMSGRAKEKEKRQEREAVSDKQDGQHCNVNYARIFPSISIYTRKSIKWRKIECACVCCCLAELLGANKKWMKMEFPMHRIGVLSRVIMNKLEQQPKRKNGRIYSAFRGPKVPRLFHTALMWNDGSDGCRLLALFILYRTLNSRAAIVRWAARTCVLVCLSAVALSVCGIQFAGCGFVLSPLLSANICMFQLITDSHRHIINECDMLRYLSGSNPTDRKLPNSLPTGGKNPCIAHRQTSWEIDIPTRTCIQCCGVDPISKWKSQFIMIEAKSWKIKCNWNVNYTHT